MRDLEGKLAEAEALGLRAVAMHRRTNGNRHTETAWALCNLAGSSKALGKHAEAAHFLQEALQIFRTHYRDDHKAIRLHVESLTNALTVQKDHVAAEQVWRETVAIRRRQFGNEHTLTAEALSQLGQVLERMGEFSAAEVQYQEALSIWQQLVEEEPDNALPHSQMAEHYAIRSQYDKATDEYAKAAAIAPISYDTGYLYAIVSAVTEDTEQFRDASSAMLQRFAADGSTIEKYLTVWSCAGAPGRR